MDDREWLFSERYDLNGKLLAQIKMKRIFRQGR